ncbi:MAG: hypothetical protein EA425_12670 [Puniceicoccaceae bacterium]|nr:MAG: hypothetical protein EA425_12670 [Puniceicoccaceae bacterium]
MPPEWSHVIDAIGSAFAQREHLLFEGGAQTDVAALVSRVASSRGWEVSTPCSRYSVLLEGDNHVFLICNPAQLGFVPDFSHRPGFDGFLGLAIHLTETFPESFYRDRLTGFPLRLVRLPALSLMPSKAS